MSERGSQRSNRPGAAQLTGMALAVWLAGAGCADAPEPQAPASHARRAPDTQRVAALEAEIAGLRANLEQAERSLRDAASGLEQQLTMADAVSALAEARVHTEAAAETAPWRRAEIQEAQLRLEEADRQIQADRYGAAAFFAMRAQGIAERVSSQTMSSSDVRRVRVERANVRSGPSREYGVVGVLLRDTPVLQEQVKGEWVRVKTPSGGSAWIHARLLESL